MKIAVVYYSLEGNTEYAAKRVQETLGDADLIRLEPVKEYPKGVFSKFLFGGKSATFSETPILKPLKFKPDEYDLIVLATPVWAGTFVPPLRTFMRKFGVSDKKLALLACSGGSSAEKVFDKFKKEFDIPEEQVAAVTGLINPAKKMTQENEDRISEFCKAILSFDD